MAATGPVRRRERGAGRARPTVQRASLPVPLPVLPTGAECAALLKALIKHLLFQRAQIPYLYDELLREAREQQQAEAEAEAAAAAEAAAGGGRRRRRRRSPKGDKRLLKFLCKAEELLASIDAALAACGVPRRAFLLLGASSAKPREVFEVLLPQPAPAPAPHGPAAASCAAGGGPAHQQQGAAVHEAAPAPQAASHARPSRQQRLCQLAVRHLVVGGAELPEGTAHTVPCKLFVLLEGPPVAADEADPAGGAVEQAAVAVPAGFATKRQFRLSMRKGTHVRLLLGQRAEEDAEQQRAADRAAEQRQRQAEEGGAAPASSDARMDGSCSVADGQEGSVTVHLSQLPDAGSQRQGAAPDPPASSGGAAGSLPAAGAARAGASSTAGSVWFMARTVLKGLNSSSGGGVAAGFDGL